MLPTLPLTALEISVSQLITQETVDLIKRFEGCVLTAYRCPAGKWTIGYGTTSDSGIGVTVSAGLRISEEQAETYLWRTLALFAEKMLPLFTTIVPTPNQFGAMLSLAYNIGLNAFEKSTCLKRFNAGDVKGAAEALQWFNKADGKKLQGLVNRRAAEATYMLRHVQEESVKADPERNSRIGSSTLKAAAAQLGTYAYGGFTAFKELDGDLQKMIVGGCILGSLFTLWIMRERLKKWAEGDR